jgi:hypothetical protein
MTYVHISRSPGVGIEEYRAVERELGPAPKVGLFNHHVGVVDGTLVVVEVWDSRTHADRFAAEHLFPAFERAGVRPGAGVDVIAFESFVAGVPA